jgi:hypothetical protein
MTSGIIGNSEQHLGRFFAVGSSGRTSFLSHLNSL